MLDDAESRGFDDVINWQAGGKSFKVYQPEYFANNVMQAYFAQTKFKSFQRQLNIYGWKKVHHGPNKGGYIHKFFVRGEPELCNRIVRRTSKDMNNPADRRDLAVDPLTLVFQGDQVISPPALVQSSTNEDGARLEEAEVDTFYDFFFSGPGAKSSKSRHVRQGSFMPANDTFSLQDAVAGHWRVNTRDLDMKIDAEDLDGFVASLHNDSEDSDDHGRRRHRRHPLKDGQQEDEELMEDEDGSGDYADYSEEDDEQDTLDAEHSFPFKLHLMLESSERDNYNHIVSWVKDGKAFKVHSNKDFVAKVLPIYFDQSKYESFRRQLNLYGFQRIARGVDRGVISHPNFVRGSRSLCREIKRKQQTKGGSGVAAHGRPQATPAASVPI